MTPSLCVVCQHCRRITSGTGSRFLLCQLAQTDRRFAKYPSQPVLVCAGFVNRLGEEQPVTDSESNSPPLCLDQFLKLTMLAETGGQAKVLIQGGYVQVNGETETRRRRKLASSDVVEVHGTRAVVKDYWREGSAG